MPRKPKSQTTCKFYLQGSCKKGNSCEWMHIKEFRLRDTSPWSQNSQNKEKSAMDIKLEHNKAAKNDNEYKNEVLIEDDSPYGPYSKELVFVDPDEETVSEDRSITSNVSSEKYNQKICKFHQMGHCRKGIKCPDLHYRSTIPIPAEVFEGPRLVEKRPNKKKKEVKSKKNKFQLYPQQFDNGTVNFAQSITNRVYDNNSRGLDPNTNKCLFVP